MTTQNRSCCVLMPGAIRSQIMLLQNKPSYKLPLPRIVDATSRNRSLVGTATTHDVEERRCRDKGRRRYSSTVLAGDVPALRLLRRSMKSTSVKINPAYSGSGSYGIVQGIVNPRATKAKIVSGPTYGVNIISRPIHNLRTKL